MNKEKIIKVKEAKEKKMRSEKEIREKIKKIEKYYEDVFARNLETVEINAPAALMQLSGTSILDGLYYVLGEQRPKFKCDS